MHYIKTIYTHTSHVTFEHEHHNIVTSYHSIYIYSQRTLSSYNGSVWWTSLRLLLFVAFVRLRIRYLLHISYIWPNIIYSIFIYQIYFASFIQHFIVYGIISRIIYVHFNFFNSILGIFSIFILCEFVWPLFFTNILV